jgi:galactokinase
MATPAVDQHALIELGRLARASGLDVAGGTIRRSSSRFCLGVEHGDYNGTELFGVGTDRFIWLAYKANDSGRVRLFSGNFPDDGVIDFRPGETPEPRSPEIAESWGRFPFGVDHVLHRDGFSLPRGADVVIHGNIPGGGMSRSASLSLNLIFSMLELNKIAVDDPMRIALLAQAVENDYIGSPCGLLDQIMILFAKEGMGTHYKPADGSVSHVPLGPNAIDFRLVSLDTGTVRPGLEKSTYRIRRAECEEFANMLSGRFGITCLAEIRSRGLYRQILDIYSESHPHLCDRLDYIFNAQARFSTMLEAWKTGDVETVGQVFREDGIGLRDQYRISGPELECMCEIARSVPGVLGERMLGGGDKGAAGALVRTANVEALKAAVESVYPKNHPDHAQDFAVHVCDIVDGITTLDGPLGSEPR